MADKKRTIFLSFLGTNNYIHCNYFPEGKPDQTVGNVQYVQEALLKILAADLSEQDRCYFFLTDLARKCNWLNNGQFNPKDKKYNAPNIGLRQRVLEMKQQGLLKAKVLPKRIPEGFSTEEIWTIFEEVFSCLKKGDRIIVDITHAFRSLPMLGMVLISYAKALREIEVEAIFYGAFEKLGPAAEVRKLPVEQRNAPILNLISFSELQDWAAAAHDFVHFGNPQRWNVLTSSGLDKVATGTIDPASKNLRQINRKMQRLAALINANRGRELHQFSFDDLNAELSKFSARENLLKPLNAIIEVVGEKLAPFHDDDPLRWLEQVNWCRKHQLWQQGITQLQEGFLTWLCDYFEERKIAEPGFFKWDKTTPRNLLSGVLNVVYRKLQEEEWGAGLKKSLIIARRLTQFAVVREMATDFSSLGNIRNDINHSGYTANTQANKFAELLNRYYLLFQKKLKENYGRYYRQGTGLLNLSNHPSANWMPDQLTAAHNLYGAVEDLSFPAVDPKSDGKQLRELIDKYFVQIVNHRPAAVHIMGEMTFTFNLVHLLKEAGIPCIASTTERIVTEENGKKIVQFQFIQFREY
ncbi:MAG: TIGR02221 family CRISPR-associated protein [Lewinellaceae bacterium]|nr:TIGR02221 family CRISPR-associated protein [Lewinellaceae bacterium]